MLTLLQAVREIVRPGLVPAGPLRLEENAPESACGAITLHKSGPAFALRPDAAAGALCSRQGCGITFTAPDRLFPIFRLDVAGLAALCDYIVFSEDQSGGAARLFVFLCELKSANVGGSRRQIENGRLLADYIIAMAKLHSAIRTLPEILLRGLVFSPNFSVPKGSLRQRRCSYEPLPDGFPDMPVARYKCGVDYPLEHFFA